MPYNNTRARRSYGSVASSSPKRPYKGSAGGKKKGNRKQYIHPSKFINRTPVEQKQLGYEPKHLFSDFALADQLKANLTKIGFTKPSAIQDQSIPLALEGRDIIGLANTGTGKTAAFMLPILSLLNQREDRGSVLVMAPTRELAQQIDSEVKRFSRDMRIFSTVIVGGTNMNRQISELRRRPHIIIGTPGRLNDLLERGELKLDHIKFFVLDEADRMLDMGFINDIRKVARLLPAGRQTLCFSATITPSISELIHEFMNNPETVSVRTSETSDHVLQDIIEADDKQHKHVLLSELLNKEEFEKVLVFGETKFGVQRLADQLSKQGIPSEAIHGNKSQGQRQRALAAFKADRVKVLIATDVAARGLDIPDVSHVINFDQPTTYSDYIHRIGRTGRGGKSGKALTFVDKQ